MVNGFVLDQSRPLASSGGMKQDKRPRAAKAQEIIEDRLNFSDSPLAELVRWLRDLRGDTRVERPVNNDEFPKR